MKGMVLWFHEKKGYGFIHPDDESKDVFVHYSGIISNEKRKHLKKGQNVEFNLSENNKGRMAAEVQVIDSPDLAVK